MLLLTSSCSPARISGAIAAMQAARQAHHVPLLRAVLAGEIALAVLRPGESLPLSLLEPTRFRQPLVVVLAGDDGLDGQHNCGPEGWRQSRRLLRWARWTILHATGGEAWHYAMAVDAARHLGRVLVAECATATLPAWQALKREVASTGAGTVIQCRPGDFHPRLSTQAEGVA